jgi:hypothetical protein
MKKITALFTLVFCLLQAQSQQNRFLYIEADRGQMFYVRIATQLWSAEMGGHVIIPIRPDSSYQISIGFPKNQYPEQVFDLPQTGKDAGYVLKLLADKGWVLLNIQSLELIVAKPVQATSQIDGQRSTNSFAILMANAVNDTLILYDRPRTKPDPMAAPLLASKKKRQPFRIV